MKKLLSLTNLTALFVSACLFVSVFAIPSMLSAQEPEYFSPALLQNAYQYYAEQRFEEAHNEIQNLFNRIPPAGYNYENDNPDEDELISAEELRLFDISVCISAAYDSFFNMTPEALWITRAVEETAKLQDEATTEEIMALLDTANAVSMICSMYQNEDYGDVLDAILETEKEAAPTDHEFFMFEIKALISCGEKLLNRDLINQAHSLYKFAVDEMKLEDYKMARLKKTLGY